MFTREGSTLGFIGLGNLGLPMAQRLVDDGWTLRACDRSPTRLTELDDRAEATTDAAWALDVDVLLLAVPSDDVVVDLTLEEHGFLRRGRRGRALIVHSTVLPETAVRLGEAAAQAGVAFVDAPVSGGAERAADGDLTLYAGAHERDLTATRGILESSASSITHVGAPGAGAAVKLANQVMMLSALGGAHEALALAEAYGVPEDMVLDAVATGTGASWTTDNWGFIDRTRADYELRGTPESERPWTKDLREAQEAATARGVALPVVSALREALAAYVERHAGPDTLGSGPTGGS